MNKLLENDEIILFRCPYCQVGEITINKLSSHKYGYCSVCDAAYIHYVPLPHQMDVHKNTHKIKLLLGG